METCADGRVSVKSSLHYALGTGLSLLMYRDYHRERCLPSSLSCLGLVWETSMENQQDSLYTEITEEVRCSNVLLEKREETGKRRKGEIDYERLPGGIVM